MQESICKVWGCRWSEHHKTEQHECGKCHKKGHGQRGCPQYNFGSQFVYISSFTRQEEKNIQKYHKKRFTIKQFAKTPEHKKSPLGTVYYIGTNLKRGEWIITYAGMGWDMYARRNYHTGLYEFMFVDDADYSNKYAFIKKTDKDNSDFFMLKCFKKGYKKHVSYNKNEFMLYQ